MPQPRNTRAELFLIMIFFESPWERVSNFCWGLKRNGDLRWRIEDDDRGWKYLLTKIGDWAERRDHAWRARYVLNGTKPHKRWARRAR